MENSADGLIALIALMAINLKMHIYNPTLVKKVLVNKCKLVIALNLLIALNFVSTIFYAFPLPPKKMHNV